MSHVVIPIDLLSRHECRGVEAGSVMRLWCELGLLARATGRLGWLPDSALPHAQVTQAEVDGMVRPLGLLERRGDGWLCSLFRQFNRHLDPNVIHNQRKGSLARVILRARKDSEEKTARDLPLFSGQQVLGDDGQPVPVEMQRRARVIIRLLDNTLGHAERPAHKIPDGVLLDAARIATAATDDEINQVAVWIHHHRSNDTQHPALPATTEQALAHWKEMLAASAPEETTA